MSDQRQNLREALIPSYPADNGCIAALDAGAALAMYDGAVPAENLLAIYTRRVEHLKKTGARTVGSDEVIEPLRVAHQPLRLASLDDSEWHFVIFLDVDGRVVSSWGVEARERAAASGE